MSCVSTDVNSALHRFKTKMEEETKKGPRTQCTIPAPSGWVLVSQSVFELNKTQGEKRLGNVTQFCEQFNEAANALLRLDFKIYDEFVR